MSLGINLIKLEKQKHCSVCRKRGVTEIVHFWKGAKMLQYSSKRRLCQKRNVLITVLWLFLWLDSARDPHPHQPCILMWNNRCWVIHCGLLEISNGFARISCMWIRIFYNQEYVFCWGAIHFLKKAIMSRLFQEVHVSVEEKKLPGWLLDMSTFGTRLLTNLARIGSIWLHFAEWHLISGHLHEIYKNPTS